MLPACQPQQPMSSKMADKYNEQAQLARKSNGQTKLAGKKAQRDAILRCIERIDNFAERANSITQEQATTRHNRLEKCWMEFEAIANELRLLDDACHSDKNEQLYDVIDENCMQIADLIRLKIIKPLPVEAPAVRVKESFFQENTTNGYYWNLTTA
ncbi:uncharacterized protein LOC121599844 [Anopheles merus]|uniref:uncharacterized protein LOC121599844 n=1 Tax=Anopheles merus TaxID=30066 RepID=UPI001BE4AE88|nr:uncharacterized protein LOC121599844 [Anopheles merus]